MPKKEMTARGVKKEVNRAYRSALKKQLPRTKTKELERELTAIIMEVDMLKAFKRAPIYEQLEDLEDTHDLYGVAFTSETRDDIIARAALARFLLAIARYFDVPPETIIQVKRAGW